MRGSEGAWGEHQLESPSHSRARGAGAERSFATELQALRLRHGLSQQALAELAGLSVPTIAALEQGLRRHPHPSTVSAVVAALGLAPTDHAASVLHELAASSIINGVALSPPRLARPRLPIPPTPLIGREAEVQAAAQALHPSNQHTRLLTMLGPGGVGKTRLALAVAEALAPAFGDNVAFVDLAPLNDARLAPAMIAHVLHVRESAGRSARQHLLDHLRDELLLLVLDNFEHLLGAAIFVSELLGECPRLALLVTSRAALRLRSEQRFPVAPLPAPPDTEHALEIVVASPAVQLLVARAVADAPHFRVNESNARAVATVCRRLDGLPLALELAAAWLRLFSPEALLARLEQRLLQLDNGPRDAPVRQQTLRATLDWSYELLGAAEQTLFRRLAVFPNGCMLEAVHPVCGNNDATEAESLNALTVLIDYSLVGLEEVPADQTRVNLLVTVREYAWQRLNRDDELTVVQRAHAAHYQALAEEAESRLTGSDQAHWLTRLEWDHDNFLAALAWARDTGELEVGLKLAGAVWRFWWVRGYLTEGRRWLDELLALDEARSADPARQKSRSRMARARALNAAAGLAFGQGDYEHARAAYEDSLALGQAESDVVRVATALHNLGYLALEQGDAERARRLSEQSLERASALTDARLIAITRINLGEAARQQGELAPAVELIGQGLALARQRGDQQYVGVALMNLGHVECDRGEWHAAEALYAEALRTHQRLGEGYTLGMAAALEGLATVAIGRGQAQRAARLLGAAAAARDTAQGLLSPTARAAHERATQAARGSLGEAAFAVGWQAGRALSLARAVDLGLHGEPAS